jgi:hypothetical protein
MGKLVNYISILIFLDLFYIITGQISTISPTSIILNAILDPSAINSTYFYVVFIGAVGIAGLAAVSGVSTGLVNRGLDVLAFTAMALGLSLMIGDFVAIYIYLFSLNKILAVMVMAPTIALFVVTIAEWLRVKD